jgi:radical SAM protein with 4Fe4S-binding SPASM domain
MKAIDITSTPPGGKRTPISELVPLKTPLLIQIFPIYACNFRCKYCEFAVPITKRCFISKTKTMSLLLFAKIINDCKEFLDKIKVLRFVGMGEPLLHPYISNMVQLASSSKLFNRIEILTNGSLLTHKISDKLIESGLTKLLISIQGTSYIKYKEVSNIDIDFDTLVSNIKYFYDNRRNIKLHIKIIDCALDNDADKQKFFDIFGDICDTIGIEIAGPDFPDNTNFNQCINDVVINQYGAKATNLEICSQPFFHMQVNPDGNVVPCYAVGYPIILGNINTETLYSIWNNKIFNQFRIKMLDGCSSTNEICKQCKIFKHRSYETDSLIDKIGVLKEYYES